MEDAPDSKILSYTVVADPVAYERLSRRSVRANTGAWLRYYVQISLQYAIVSAVAFSAGSMAIDQATKANGMIGAGCFGFIGGIVCCLVLTEESVKRGVKAVKDKQWDCRLTDRSYEFTDKNGVTLSIPWAIMKIRLEDPGAWQIRYGDQELMIFRKPLRDAGLEEEFLRRLNASSEPSA